MRPKALAVCELSPVHAVERMKRDILANLAKSEDFMAQDSLGNDLAKLILVDFFGSDRGESFLNGNPLAKSPPLFSDLTEN